MIRLVGAWAPDTDQFGGEDINTTVTVSVGGPYLTSSGYGTGDPPGHNNPALGNRGFKSSRPDHSSRCCPPERRLVGMRAGTSTRSVGGVA
jgi:hypothetical protein